MNKIIIINENKKRLESLIQSILEKIEYNNNFIKKLKTDCNNFFEYIEIIKIFKIYEWDNIKKNYNLLKKKLKNDRKIYNLLVKLYGDIIIYYTSEQNNLINTDIKLIYSILEQLDSNFIFFKIFFKSINLKCIQFNKNKKILKISELNDLYNDILLKLDNIFLEIRMLNKKKYYLKKRKSKLSYEIWN